MANTWEIVGKFVRKTFNVTVPTVLGVYVNFNGLAASTTGLAVSPVISIVIGWP